MESIQYDSLVQEAVLGDPIALASLVEHYRRELFACITVCLGPAAQYAEDVLQETVIAALASVREFDVRPGSSFLAWLIRIGQHKAIDARRHMDAEVRLGRGAGGHAGDSSGIFGVNKIPGLQTTPSSNFARKEAGTLLYSAVQQLDDRLRAAVLLHLVNEFTYIKTAEIMSTLLRETITDGQAKHYVRQGLLQLEELLPAESAFFTDVSEDKP